MKRGSSLPICESLSFPILHRPILSTNIPPPIVPISFLPSSPPREKHSHRRQFRYDTEGEEGREGIFCSFDQLRFRLRSTPGPILPVATCACRSTARSPLSSSRSRPSTFLPPGLPSHTHSVSLLIKCIYRSLASPPPPPPIQ